MAAGIIAPMWQLDLLGPPRLHRDGADVPLPLKKAQALLLLLALEGTLPRPRVVSLLWPQLDESTARRNLRRELARLREAGAGDTVTAQADLLGLAPGLDTDVHAFEADLRAQAPDDALRRWRGALADGLALPDAPDFEDWLAQQRERWWRLRAQALEDSAAACERRGDLTGALARVRSLLEQDPLQEQRHRDAMRLLAASGQREAALAQYERCRALLRDELGLAPMAQTEALMATLRQASGEAVEARPHNADAPTSATDLGQAGDAVPPSLPEQLPFVGRADEVRALEAAWQTGVSLLIEGEAGIGKTRLSIDFVAAHGPHAVVRCRASDAAVPYAAYTRALRAMAGPAPAREPLPAGVAEELARLLPEFGPAPEPLRNDAERARFVEACVDAWHAIAADNFDAVVLDDWHHADAASRELLMRIAERRQDLRATGVVGAREVLVYRAEGELAPLADHIGAAAGRGSAGAAPVPALTGAAPAHRVRLGRLPPAAVLGLVQQLSGAPVPQRFSQRLLAATAGNPFFVAETLRHWVEQGLLAVDAAGHWSTPYDMRTEDYAELPVPGSVYATVLERVQRTPAGCRRVLEAAALAGEPFAPGLLAPACALSELDAVLAIESAVQAQLLREHEAGGYAFVHDLVQQAIDSALAPERRRLVHRRLALAAEATGAAPSTIALHHEASGEPTRAVPFRLQAGDVAFRLHALREAVAHWQQGLADRPQPEQALELRARLMQAATALSRQADVREHGNALLALAHEGTVGPPARVRAIVLAATHLAQAGSAAEALAELDTLPRDLPPAEQRQVLSARANALLFLGRSKAARTLVHRTLDEPDLGDRQRAEVLYQLGANELVSGQQAAAADHLEAAIALQRRLPDGSALDLLRMTFTHGTVLYQLGRFEEAAAMQEETAAGAARVGHRRLEARAWFNLAPLRIAQRRPVESLDVARRVRALLQGEPDLEFSAMLRCRFVEAHAMNGEFGAAWSEAREAVPEILAAPRRPYTLLSVAMNLSELLELLGDRTTLQPLVDVIDRLDAEDPQLYAGLAQVSLEMWVARAQAAMLAGDPAAAAQALGRVDEDVPIEDLRVRHRTQVARAELALHRGRAEDVADLMPPPAEITEADGHRIRAWAVHVRAAAAEGTLTVPLVEAARQALQAEPSAVVPAVPALHLHRALAGVAGSLPSALAAAVRVDAAAHVHRLAATLDAWPEAQAAFVSRWAP